MHIEKATTDDVLAIQKLLRETWLDTYGEHLSKATLEEVSKHWHTVQFLTEQINDVAVYFPIMKDGDSVVGLATARMDGDAIMFLRLYVSPEHQRKGIGEVLLLDVIKHFSDAKSIQLTAEEFNQKGLAFYAKHGFTIVNRKREKVGNEKIEVILMEKKL